MSSYRVLRRQQEQNDLANYCCHSVTESCLTLSDTVDCTTSASCPSLSPGACSNSCPLCQWCHPIISSSSPPALVLSQHQGLFQWVGSSHQMAEVLELQLQHQSYQRIFRTDFLKVWLVWFPCSPRDSQESSPEPQFESINSSTFSLLYGPTLISVHDYWKDHSLDYTDISRQSDVFIF